MNKLSIITALALTSFMLANAEESVVTASVTSDTSTKPVLTEKQKREIKEAREIKEKDVKKFIKNSPEIEAQIKALNQEMETKIKALREEYNLKIKAIIGSSAPVMPLFSPADKPGKREGMDEGRKLGVPFMMASTTASGTPQRLPSMRIENERNENQERVDKKVMNFFRGFFGGDRD